MISIRSINPVVSILVLAAAFGCGKSDLQTDQTSRDTVPGAVLMDDMENADRAPQTLQDEAGYLGFWYVYDDTEDCLKDACCRSSDSYITSCADAPASGCGGEVLNAGADANTKFLMSPISEIPASAAPPAGSDVANELAASTMAVRLQGDAGFTTWGAGLGVGFNVQGGAPTAWSVPQEFSGIRFLAVAPAATGPVQVIVKMPDSSSDPVDGKCIARTTCAADDLQGCYADWKTTVSVTSTWTKFELPFSSFDATDFPGRYVEGMKPSALDLDRVYQLQFQVVEKGVPFDIYFDNVGFTLGQRGGSAGAPPAATAR